MSGAGDSGEGGVRPIRLARGFFTVGMWTMLSRVLGFLRDILFAAFLGAGPVAEAFLVAFSLPNMFRRIFAEGAFNTAFVPMFSKKLENKDRPEDFAKDATSALGAALFALVLAAQLLMPLLVLGMASGFVADGRFDLAVFYGRIAFPYVLFISMAALVSGVLNATGRFAAGAAAPVLLNVIFIGSIGIAAYRGLDIGLVLSCSVPLAGAAQLALVWHAASRAGFRIVPRWPELTPDLKRLLVIAAPAALAGGVVQVNLLIGRQVASFHEGAVAWLNYADRLYQLPLGVVGIAIGVVLLPDLSRKLAGADAEGARNAFNRSAETALALALPATVAFVVVPLPLTGVLFERGAFSAIDTAATANALLVYAIGLPAFVLQKVLQAPFFAREDTKTPFKYALASMLLNAAVAIGLSGVAGYLAAAIGTTASGCLMAYLLWRGSRGMGIAATLDNGFRRRMPRIAAAALAMGLFLWLAREQAGGAFELEGIRYVALAALVLSGAAVYGAALLALRVWTAAEVMRTVRRR